MKTPDRGAGNLKEEIRKKYLAQGFIDGSTLYGVKLEEQMWGKKVTAVFAGGDSPRVYTDLKITSSSDLKGYGFRFPDGSILLISRFDRNLEEQPLKGWLFKIE